MGMFNQRTAFNEKEAARLIEEKSMSLDDQAALDALIDKIGDSRIVMLGEASHGTHEYYTWRSYITKRLLTQKNFNFIAVEGDWPDCYNINKFIKGQCEPGTQIRDILK